VSKRVLVTGGTGFVGANLVRRLRADGHTVDCVVRPRHRSWRLDDLGDWRPRVVDLLDRSAVFAFVRDTAPEWILHLAAYGAYESQSGVTDAVRTNVEATINLIDAAVEVGVERFVNAGSSSEYGYKAFPPGEDERLDPNSLYAVTKAAASNYLRHVSERSSLHGVTLRLYSVFGPWEEPTRLIPKVILCGLRGVLPPLVAPEIARDFIHVDDVVRAFSAVLAADIEPGRIYNVGTGTQTRIRDVVDVARRYFGISAEPEWGSMPSRKWDTASWVADCSRLKEETGWSPDVTFADGFRHTAAWLVADENLVALYEKESAPT
jgi:dolichol-phosphate mannosyltransferase